MGPGFLASAVVDVAMNDALVKPVHADAGHHVAKLPFTVLRSPSERKSLDYHRVCVSHARLEECSTLFGFHAKEVARKKNEVEPALKVESFDPRGYGFGIVDMCQHRGGLIHSGDGITETDKLPRNPARSAAELKD